MNIELTKLVDTVIGGYRSCASHGYDIEVLKHLDTVEELIIHLLASLCVNIHSAENCTADSVMQVGIRSREIIDKIHELIDEV